MTAFFSIGVTTYNRRDLLMEALSSILGQTFHDYEVLVGNDYTEERLSGHLLGLTDERIRFVNHPRNLGEVRNMNFLLAESRGRYFTWLADDDVYAPTFLEAVHATLVKFGYLSCVFTSYMAGTTFPERLEMSVREGECFEGRQFLQLYLTRALKTQGCYGVFDTEYLRRIGGMEQLGDGFSPYSDNLLVIRSGLLEKVVYINAPLVFFRTHAQSISWTSPNAHAYRSAQEDLCCKSLEVFRNEGLSDDSHFNLYLLLRWCLNDFYAVVSRSGSLQGHELISYLAFMKRYTTLLGDYRYRMTIVILRSTYKLVIQLMRSQLKRQFLRKFRIA